MARVTEDDVRPLLDGIDSGQSLAPFIEQASMLVDEELQGHGSSDRRLKNIELNLAAHFAVVAVERGGLTYREMGQSQEGYANDRSQVRISSTRFGQQALAMDTTGILSTLDSPRGRAEFRVL